MKVFIWGTGKLAEECVADLLPDVEIIGFIETVPEKDEFYGYRVISGEELVGREYDYVILANSHEEDILREFKLNVEKIAYYRLSIERDSGRKVHFVRKNVRNIEDDLFKSQKKLEIVESAREVMPYISVQSDGLKFLFDWNDNLIANDILGSGKTYSKEEMHFLYEMAPKVASGYFFDIGANIGTTSVYFRKNICNSLKYIAFEPLKENFKVLKANCILNDCEDIQTINKGMSNVTGQKKMYIFDGAFGSSMVTDSANASETCDFITLDDFIRENDLPVEEIAYFWVDVQCHELEVIEGGLDTLKNSAASLYIEFNVENYRKENKAEKFLSLLAEIYSTFICYEQYEKGRSEIRNVKELAKLSEEIDLPFCNILLMK